MSRIKVEAFSSTSNNPHDVSLTRLLDDIKTEFGNKVEIITYTEQNELFKKYNLTATPAVVIEEMIKIIGFLPSKETLVKALEEMGL